VTVGVTIYLAGAHFPSHLPIHYCSTMLPVYFSVIADFNQDQTKDAREVIWNDGKGVAYCFAVADLDGWSDNIVSVRSNVFTTVWVCTPLRGKCTQPTPSTTNAKERFRYCDLHFVVPSRQCEHENMSMAV
jgi:hypothetical protein